MTLMRGAIPTPRNKLASAHPHAIVGPTPPQLLYLPKQLDMWGNANFGDCVTAEEAFAKACHQPEVFLPAHKIIKWARNHFVLNGAGLWEVLSLMRTEGIDHGNVTYGDGMFSSVDWCDSAILRNAISRGPIKLGVAADQLINVLNIGISNGWVAMGLTAGDPLDHCTSLCGYGPFGWLASELGVSTAPAGVDQSMPAYAMFTWSTIGIIDEPSLIAITGEAWLRTPTTIQTTDTH